MDVRHTATRYTISVASKNKSAFLKAPASQFPKALVKGGRVPKGGFLSLTVGETHCNPTYLLSNLKKISLYSLNASTSQFSKSLVKVVGVPKCEFPKPNGGTHTAIRRTFYVISINKSVFFKTSTSQFPEALMMVVGVPKGGFPEPGGGRYCNRTYILCSLKKCVCIFNGISISLSKSSRECRGIPKGWVPEPEGGRHTATRRTPSLQPVFLKVPASQFPKALVNVVGVPKGGFLCLAVVGQGLPRYGQKEHTATRRTGPSLSPKEISLYS